MLRQTTSSVPIFANGAISAAFVYMFNDWIDNLKQYSKKAEKFFNSYQFKVGIGGDVRVGDSASMSGGILFGGERGVRLYFETAEGEGILGFEVHLEAGYGKPGSLEGTSKALEVEFLNIGVETGDVNGDYIPDYVEIEYGTPSAGGGYQTTNTRSVCLFFCP